ncbi:MAG: immune inhibitor A, partial [Candidatus Cloacimonetes bacterium]|nr:immune inhibitor A [Candidatus Cloacimonadota bacterium]
YSGGLAETEQMLRYGTTAAPKGTVTAIGMSTSSTHTTFNNVLHGGIFAGLFAHDMRTMGEALLHGKLYMAQIFGVSSPANVNSFTHWCNLMGDPTMEVYTGIPNHFNVQSNATISLGLTLYDVVVTDSASVPVSGAAVTLSMGSTIISRGFTLEDGSVILILPSGMTVGDAVLTVSAHNFRPQQTTIPVASVPTLVPDSMIVNDVTGGALIGNGNGIAGSGETVEVTFGLTNTGTTTISGISGTISSENANVVILNPTISYPAISGGEFGTNATPIVIQIAPNTPHESMIRLYLHLTDSSSVAYVVSEFLPVESAKIEYVSSLVSDGNNQFLDPGETAEFKITIKNIGTASVSGINATLHSMNDMLAIPDNMAVFGGVAADSLVTCTTDGFTLSARPESIPGTIVPMQMHLFNDAGFDQNVEFMFTLGHTSNHDPLGPDSHGYVIYDWLDIGYPEAPVYDWHGIAPSEGGLGTALPISDGYSSSDEGDQEGASPLAVVNLPFPFQFYGRPYQQITVCSNGFIALGVTANAEFRNFRLPGAMGPNPMIAAFWDDLATVSGSGIYTWYNVNNQTFTIEWYNLRNGGGTGTSPETFQVILYNQAVYPTSFGDGPIKIQYHTFNNIDNQSGNEHGNYCTIGIEDHTGKVGLEYTFNNTYPIAAAPLSNRKAIYITNAPTFIAEPHLIVNGTYISDDNNNGVCEPNEDISLGVSIMNSGNVIANDINAVLSTTNPFVTMNMDSSLYYPIAPGDSGVNRIPYTFHVSPTCPDGEVINFSLHVTAGEDEWDRAFSFQVKASSLKYQSFMVDDHAANFNGIVDTGESVNLIVNLLNESVVAASNVSLNLISSNAQLVVLNPQLTLDSIAPNDIIQLSFQIDCSAVPGTVATLPFQLTASSSNGSPLTAEFQVLYNNPDIAADFELNRGSFVPETGWAWGTPSQFAPHSGQKLWATNLSGNYPDLVQYNLYSPAYLLSTGSVMSFYHRYGFENNVDGANVSISSDGGETWTVIPPVGAYNANSLGALDGETGWTGVTTQWLNPSFDLSQYAGQNVMFRFRFGSDAATSNTGWFIDDFQLSGVNKKQGYLHGLLFPTSGISPVYGKVSSNQRYTTHPDVDGNYMLFLPYGLHSVTA